MTLGVSGRVLEKTQLDVSDFVASWFLTPLIKRRYNPNNRFDLLAHCQDAFLGRLRPIKIFSLARQQRFP